jgi:hypothetical protein
MRLGCWGSVGHTGRQDSCAWAAMGSLPDIYRIDIPLPAVQVRRILLCKVHGTLHWKADSLLFSVAAVSYCSACCSCHKSHTNANANANPLFCIKKITIHTRCHPHTRSSPCMLRVIHAPLQLLIAYSYSDGSAAFPTLVREYVASEYVKFLSSP